VAARIVTPKRAIAIGTQRDYAMLDDLSGKDANQHWSRIAAKVPRLGGQGTAA